MQKNGQFSDFVTILGKIFHHINCYKSSTTARFNHQRRYQTSTQQCQFATTTLSSSPRHAHEINNMPMSSQCSKIYITLGRHRHVFDFVCGSSRLCLTRNSLPVVGRFLDVIDTVIFYVPSVIEYRIRW